MELNNTMLCYVRIAACTNSWISNSYLYLFYERGSHGIGIRIEISVRKLLRNYSLAFRARILRFNVHQLFWRQMAFQTFRSYVSAAARRGGPFIYAFAKLSETCDFQGFRFRKLTRTASERELASREVLSLVHERFAVPVGIASEHTHSLQYLSR